MMTAMFYFACVVLSFVVINAGGLALTLWTPLAFGALAVVGFAIAWKNLSLFSRVSGVIDVMLAVYAVLAYNHVLPVVEMIFIVNWLITALISFIRGVQAISET